MCENMAIVAQPDNIEWLGVVGMMTMRGTWIVAEGTDRGADEIPAGQGIHDANLSFAFLSVFRPITRKSSLVLQCFPIATMRVPVHLTTLWRAVVTLTGPFARRLSSVALEILAYALFALGHVPTAFITSPVELGNRFHCFAGGTRGHRADPNILYLMPSARVTEPNG